LKQFALFELPLPDCIFAGVDGDGEIVVLEDLTDVGYGMADRLKGLDYQQCSVVMKVNGFYFDLINLRLRIAAQTQSCERCRNWDAFML
jgi:hypothetical protein